MADEIPQWAALRAFNLSNLAGAGWTTIRDMLEGYTGRAFARYIAEHEEPPVDPVLTEAREIASATCTKSGNTHEAELCLSGGWDAEPLVSTAYTALRRGMELAREQSK
jgi:hypothetical protein